MELNQISGKIIEYGIKVHRALGPGMLESAYEACLFYELQKNGLKVEKQVLLPIIYDGVKIDAGYRIDLFVENEVIIELKAVEKLHPIHRAQLLSYLKLSDKKLGLLMNFNVNRLVDGVRSEEHTSELQSL